MNGSGPRTWQEIHAELSRRIVERQWKPGELVPNEMDLAKEFGCARGTVNRAMRELAAAGVVERRRKAGTRVTLNPVRKATLDIPVTRLEIERRGATYQHLLLSRELGPAPRLVAGRLKLPQDAQLLHVRALHLADNAPFLYEDRWINPAVVPAILEVDLNGISANEWLVRNAPFTRGDISFSAAGADAEQARHLAAPAGAALFMVERTTWNGEVPITFVHLAYAPGFRMHTTI